MPRRDLTVAGYRGMWLVVMFDLPVKTPKDRKAYAHFRKQLLVRGFSMLQYSVYAHYCDSEESSAVFRAQIRALLPEKGHVRLLLITDRQFGKMESFIGIKSRAPEKPPKQLLLF